MMEVLRAAQSVGLPDWMIGAGFIRNKVWDHLHGYAERTPLADIDLIYFDPSDLDEKREKEYDARLVEIIDAPWSTKNQARMHSVNNNQPYSSSEEALAHWIETPTCTAVKLLEDGTLRLIAPHGIEDLVSLVVRPSPLSGDSSIYAERIARKKWEEKWPRLHIRAA